MGAMRDSKGRFIKKSEVIVSNVAEAIVAKIEQASLVEEKVEEKVEAVLEGSIELGSIKGLVIDRTEVLKRAPSAASNKKYERLTDAYLHVNTVQVLDDMQEHGWFPIAARETRNTAPGRTGCNKHMIVLANTNDNFKFSEGHITTIITNAHDGSHSLQIRVGIFRKVCSNGLVTGKDIIEPIRITHREYNKQRIAEIAQLVSEKANQIYLMIDKLQNTVVSSNMKYTLAMTALQLKFTPEQLSNIQVDIDELTAPTRDEDRGNSAWQLFNIVQEKVMKGITYTTTRVMKNGTLKTYTKTTKELKRVDTIIGVNESLWSATERLIAA